MGVDADHWAAPQLLGVAEVEHKNYYSDDQIYYTKDSLPTTTSTI